MVDVVNKKCQFKGGCNKIPVYNYTGEHDEFFVKNI